MFVTIGNELRASSFELRAEERREKREERREKREERREKREERREKREENNAIGDAGGECYGSIKYTMGIIISKKAFLMHNGYYGIYMGGSDALVSFNGGGRTA